MPAFGTTSKKRLATLAEPLRLVLGEAILYYDFSIICGHRDKAGQDAAYYSTPQRSKVKWPNSRHNVYPSLAVDVAPYYSEKPHIRWNRLCEFVYLHGIIAAVAKRRGVAIRSGINWDQDDELITDQDFNDFPHIELII